MTVPWQKKEALVWFNEHVTDTLYWTFEENDHEWSKHEQADPTSDTTFKLFVVDAELLIAK